MSLRNLAKKLSRKLLSPWGLEVASSSRINYLEFESRLPKPTLNALQLTLAWLFQSGRAEESIFLQIGACDGIEGDAGFPFLRQGKMKAFLVEPIEETYQHLCSNYNDVPHVTCINRAIGEIDGTAPFYTVDGIPNCQIASFDRSHLEKHIEESEMGDVVETEITVSRYGTLLSDFSITNLDFVAIDAEGQDCKILNQILEHKTTLPGFIYFENLHIPADEVSIIFDRLEGSYVWIHDDWNTLAIRTDLAELIQ